MQLTQTLKNSRLICSYEANSHNNNLKAKSIKMFQKKPSQQPQQLEPQQQSTRQNNFSESMMIGQINLQGNNTINSVSIVQNKQVAQKMKYLCSECTFEKTVELSQQIIEHKKRISWFEAKIKEVQDVRKSDQSVLKDLFAPFQQSLQKELRSQEQAKIQLKNLQLELQLIQYELQQEIKSQLEFQTSVRQFITQRQQLQHQLETKQSQLYQLTQQYQQLLQKHQSIEPTLTLFETTNIPSILYSITFQNTHSYLNGEKITHQNSWKLVQIVLFYQTKYDGTYHPLYHIFWPQMKLQRDPDQHLQQSSTNLLASINLGNLLKKQSAKEVDIDCESQQKVLNKWMPCLLMEVRNLFGFVNRQAGKQQKLRYEISKQGEFQFVKNKTFKTFKDKFALVVKCLMMDLDQLNKIEFFARENRVNSNGE